MRQAHTREHRDARLFMARMDDPGNRFRHAPHQDAGLGLDYRHMAAPFGGRGSEFEPDEAATDDDDAAAHGKPLAQLDCVIMGAQCQRVLAARN